ncbi:SIS domain-containing protein [Oleiagrimonas sp.]|jgi:glucosamine--fructose-6-phosphate aminotransferase (isomerizing)|uniref:SIS domain-containing protein n=1 Tax=Oleiagrimonas sp. TaxID=2010330 RepID=UPI00260A822F|nr:SIS domain-containing protein [Oleiagrimonas sp.]MDA3912854.1 SIS domain-containing protein [Oleiagrimonas sp.]
MSHQTLMHAEAAEAAEVVERQLAGNEAPVRALVDRLRARPPAFIVTCARGSSDHAATFAKYAFETRLGLVTASASPSVESVYAAPLQMRNTLFLAISQSGQSPDLLRSVEAARASGAYVVALVNVEDSPLAKAADTVLPLRAGPERSVAATKSYLGALFSILQLTAHWSANAALMEAMAGVPDALRSAFRQDWSPLIEGLRDARNLFVLGRGYGYGAAQEAALKFKETCGLHAEAFSTAEVRHGPMALVDSEFPVLLLAQDDGTQRGALDVANEFRLRGARVWTAAPGDRHADALPIVPAADPLLAPLLAVQSFYRAANALAIARGHDPDVPPHLNKVTETV